MYLKPSPMKPDTFSQYGYADAANLRALRRGYGHDIYPQYPTTYNMPRLVQYGNYVSPSGAGLGAFTHKGFTVDYYANQGSLDFDDKNLKKLYEGLRNFDIEWQKNLNGIMKNLEPLLGAVEMLSGGGIKAKEVRKAFVGPFPSSGPALLLEVAAGKRPLDQGFRAAAKVQAQNLKAAATQLGLVGTVSGLLAGGAAAGVAASLGAGAPLAAITGALTPVAAIAVPAAVVCGVASATLATLSTGKPPSKADFAKSVKDTAALTGQKAPTDAEINVMYAGLTAAAKPAAQKAGKTEEPTKLRKVRRAGGSPSQGSEPTVPPPEPPAAKPSTKGVSAVVIGAAALAAVLIATR